MFITLESCHPKMIRTPTTMVANETSKVSPRLVPAGIDRHQLDLITPGIIPLLASSRKQIRHNLKRRI